MADRTMVITWGSVVRGREERALENFDDIVGLYGRMQQEGRIAKFSVALLQPNAQFDGFMQLDGDAAQLAAVREDAEFRRLMTESSLIVDDLCVLDGHINEGIPSQMSVFRDAVSKVPQAA